MFRGTVRISARIKGNGLTFPSCVFYPNEAGVEKVEIESPKGHEILSTVYLDSVASENVGTDLATKVNSVALNRISFHHNLVIEEAQTAEARFSPLNPPAGPELIAGAASFVIIGGQATFIKGIDAASLKSELEQVTVPGELNFGLLRSARLSTGPVEEFMHLYHILLMLFSDSQAAVDNFIRSQDSAVPQTQHPMKSLGVMETVYSRLRNEFAHKRAGVNVMNTKLEMESRVGDLLAFTKKAIELKP